MNINNWISTIEAFMLKEKGAENGSARDVAIRLVKFLMCNGIREGKCPDTVIKVYEVRAVENAVFEITIEEMDQNGFSSGVNQNGKEWSVHASWFGDDVFFTKEEAERDLKENREKHLEELREYYRSEGDWDLLEELEEELEEVRLRDENIKRDTHCDPGQGIR